MGRPFRVLDMCLVPVSNVAGHGCRKGLEGEEAPANGYASHIANRLCSVVEFIGETESVFGVEQARVDVFQRKMSTLSSKDQAS